MHPDRPRIAVHSPWALDDPRSWSGVVTPMLRHLEAHHDVQRVPPLEVGDALVDRVRARLSRRPVLPSHSTATADRRSRALSDYLRLSSADLLVTIAASTDLVRPLPLPVLQITDATFPAVLDFYPQFTGLGAGSRRQGREVERRSAARTARFLVASEWAERSLREDVGVPAARIDVAPFGPGVAPRGDLPPRSAEDGPLELLLVAGDWHRKNGDAALAIHAALQQRRPARLTIVGDPPSLGPTDGVRVLGRLSPDELSGLYAESDVLLEPSRANASGVVITDALTHGLPVLATAVGGVPTLVRPGVGGWLVYPAALVDEAVRVLAAVDHDALRALSTSVREDARARLSWEAWGRAADAAISALTSPPCGREGRQRP